MEGEMAPQLITLLTDLGATDAYVGIVKGVLYAHAPSARIVDLTHAADRSSVHAAAYLALARPAVMQIIVSSPYLLPLNRLRGVQLFIH
jgi:hypothetical protein